MSRKIRELRGEAENRWPALQQFLTNYRRDRSIADRDANELPELARQWWDWNRTVGTVGDIRPLLEHGFGVKDCFETPIKGRHFMNSIYDELIVAIRIAEPGWRP